MRKIFYLLAILTIFNGYMNAQGGSTCTTINIYCTDEQNFLDSVETKLLKAIDRIKKGEKIPIDCYWVIPNDAIDFIKIRLTNQEIKNEILPKKYLPTYRYELIIDWNDTLNKGYIIGFSKEYGYEKNILEYSHNKGEQIPGIYIEPFYHVPLSLYKTFLNPVEMARLYKIIQKNFINYIDVDTANYGLIPVDTSFLCQMYSDTSLLSRQTIKLDNNDPFILMPLCYWVNRFKDWIQDGVQCYKDASLSTKYSSDLEAMDIYERIDTLTTDENGNKVPVRNTCMASSIAVALKWTFDTLNLKRPYNEPSYAMRIKKETQSVAVITHCSNDSELPTPDKIGWLSFKDVDAKSRRWGFHYYESQLDNALFKKLNLQYYKW